MPKQKKEVQEKGKKFSLSLSVNGEKYEAKGATLLECIEKVFDRKKFSKITVKTKGILLAESGKSASKEIPFHPVQIKRLLINGLARKLLEKRLEMYFK